MVGAIIAGLMLWCVERCIALLDRIILGMKHQKSLEYTEVILWYIKCKADIF